jgi:hypothetical protein
MFHQHVRSPHARPVMLRRSLERDTYAGATVGASPSRSLCAAGAADGFLARIPEIFSRLSNRVGEYFQSRRRGARLVAAAMEKKVVDRLSQIVRAVGLRIRSDADIPCQSGRIRLSAYEYDGYPEPLQIPRQSHAVIAGRQADVDQGEIWPFRPSKLERGIVPGRQVKYNVAEIFERASYTGGKNKLILDNENFFRF